MAKEFKTGYKVTGDASGGVRAAQVVRSELDKLNQSIEKQTKLGSLATGGFGKYVAKIAGAGAVVSGAIVSIGAFAKSIADPVDRIGDLSAQLGISTEFLSGMGFAAEMSGSSVDALAVSVRKMEQSIIAASDGTATQVQAFDRLGLSIDEIRRLSPEQQFVTIAEKIGALEDISLRTATAVAIFGKSGAELAPLFADGTERVAGLRAEAERLGLVISQDFADQAGAFNDAMDASNGVITGVKRQIGEGLLPELTALAQQFVDSAEATDVWEDVGQFLGNLVRVLVAGFVTLKEIVVITAQAIWTAGKNIVDTLAAIVAPLFEFSKTIAASFAALSRGDFAAAADAFTGLGTRMKDAFVDNISLIKLNLQEFGADASARITKAVGTVNDILTKQAVVSQGAAAGIEGLADQTDQGAKAAAQAAKDFQTLNDRLDPLAKLGRQFTVEQAVLVGKIAEGGEGVALYTQLLEKLKLEYAEAARNAVGFGEKAVAASDKAALAAEKAAQKAAAAAQKEADKRAEALAKQAADVDTFQKAFERGVERIDDLGADLWKGWFTGAKNAMDSIKSFFQNWLGELAHAAITRPILVNITAALGLGSSAAAVAGGVPGAGIGGAVGGITGGGGAAGLGVLGGLRALLGGGGIGSAFTSLGGFLPGFLGGTAGTGVLGPTAAGGNIAGGIFANAGNVSNLSFGIAGILGGILGDKIFGGQGGIGGSLGAVIGTAILPGIGSVIGGALGGFLGGLFGKKNKPDLELSGTQILGGKFSQADFESLLGGGFLRTRGIDAAQVAEIGKDIAAFDDAIAGLLTSEQLAAATERLKTFDVRMQGSAISIEQLLQGRFDTILSTLSAEIRTFVKEVAGIEEQAQRLRLANLAQAVIDAAPELFEGRTFREFIAVAEAMQASGEDLTATFQRLANEVLAITQQMQLIQGFASSNLTADFDALVAQQGQSLFDLAGSLGDQIRTLRAGFTGSADDLSRLSVLVSQRYDSEIAFLTQIKQISDGIGSGFQSLRDTINRDLFGDEAFFNDLTSRAEQLAAELKTLTDPAQISATVAEIQRLTGTAFGLLDDAGKQASGQGFLDFINGVETDAQAALTLARDLFVDESAVLRDLVADMAEQFGDPLEIAATAHEGAAKALESSAESLTAAAAAVAATGSGLVDAVRFGFRLLANDVISAGSAAAPAGVIVAGGGGATSPSTLSSSDVIAKAVAAAVLQAGAASAQAIKQSASTVQVQVVFPGRGMVNA